MPRRVSADDGTPLEMAILIDLTTERQARAQIDRSLDEMAQWFDLSPVGMLVVDETGLVLRSNAAFEALVGRAPVMLWVLEFNWGARAFYKKLGGREIARHSFDLAGVPTPEAAYGWPADGTPAVRAP